MADYSVEQIRTIEKKNKDLEEKIRNIETVLERNNSAKFNEFKSVMRRQLQENDANRRSEYESRLAELKFDISSEIDSSQREVMNQYDTLRKEILDARREFEEENARLKRYLDKIVKSDAEKDERRRVEAEKAIGEAHDCMLEVNELPCETFFRGKIQIHNETLANAKSLIKDKLYQAAIAVSVSAKAAISIFGIDVKKQVEAWEREYKKLKERVDSIVKVRDAWYTEWIEMEDDPVLQNRQSADTDICFWTNNEYEKCKDKVEELENLVKTISEMGTTKYLKGKDPISFEQLSQKCIEADELMDKQKILFDLYANCLDAEAERFTWAKSIVKYLKEEKSFRYDKDASGCDSFVPSQINKDYIKRYLDMYKEDDTSDIRGIYRLFFDREDGLKVEIGIIPIRIGNSSVVVNIVRYHVYLNERKKVEEPRYIGMVDESIKAAVKLSKTDNCSNADIRTTNIDRVMEDMSKAKDATCRQWARERLEKEIAIDKSING